MRAVSSDFGPHLVRGGLETRGLWSLQSLFGSRRCSLGYSRLGGRCHNRRLGMRGPKEWRGLVRWYPLTRRISLVNVAYGGNTAACRESTSCAAVPGVVNQKLSVQAKKVAYNVYAQVRKSDPQLSVRAACRKVSKLTGVSERSVFRIKLDVNSGTLKSPKRKRLRLPAMDDRAKTGKTRLELHDSFSLAALGRKVHQYFLRNELPTAAKLAQDVTSDSDMNMSKMSVRTMQRLLNDIGFSFRKRKRNCELLERDDIITWRRRYLRTIRQLRAQIRDVHEELCNHYMNNLMYHSPSNLGPRVSKSRHNIIKIALEFPKMRLAFPAAKREQKRVEADCETRTALVKSKPKHPSKRSDYLAQ
ncbi:hypothetical protein HPB51_004935 [Rhipicephalus microplus]|uniref:Uncharacterized protein n=1 Tax=Rhipicephalus microplus TaxID=6941 RepID=A0A9J6DZT3_RHIMP|nr:hypothetical protein HPB51_004935 [Rhipicephalus microplus]